MKRLLLFVVTAATAILASKYSSAGGNATPILIIGAFAFFFVLALVNPPEKRNLSQREKQDSLLRTLGVELPPHAELEPEEEEPDKRI